MAELSERPMTPLPYQKIAVLVMVFLGDSLCMSVVLPFVPFMVKTYLGLPPDRDYLVGYYAGAVAGAYIAGQLCTAPLWGALSDRVGRRPVMLACLFLSAACLLAFGAAPDLRFALVARFAHGLCSGNVVVAKSMMADLTDETNEADAFVYVGVTFGAGAMLGPLIGGALCEPATKYAGLPLMALWAERPYLLPCAVVAAVTLLDLAAAAVLLEESKPETPDAPADGVSDAAADAGVRELLRDPGSPFRAVCASFVLFGLCFMAFQEVFPVFGRAPVAEGGLGLDSTSVGVLQAAAGAATLAGVVAVYPPLARRVGVPGAYACALLTCAAAAYPAPPLLAYASAGDTPWLALAAANGAVSLATEVSFTSLNLMLKRSAPPNLVGAAIGAGSSLGMLGLAFGPVFGGSLFAASSDPAARLPPALAQGRLFFLAISLVALANAGLVANLPSWPAEPGAVWRRAGGGYAKVDANDAA
ncbi:major facilitator protein [Aureococcus anophagefferens]|uniref:Major facilitator protein n=1 Tax=Aureococcus anophagefferens TaxID=44056 RepID=A0ABR1FUQ9_AURAN